LFRPSSPDEEDVVVGGLEVRLPPILLPTLPPKLPLPSLSSALASNTALTTLPFVRFRFIIGDNDDTDVDDNDDNDDDDGDDDEGDDNMDPSS